MKYIVWVNTFDTMSSGTQGGGFFVSYKNKLTDLYSENWFDAKKYSKIGYATNKIGINVDSHFSFDDFIKKNINKFYMKGFNRDKTLSDLEGLSTNEWDIFKYYKGGRIWKVDDNNLIGTAEKEIYEYIISKSYDFNTKVKKNYSTYQTKNIVTHVEGEDFWEGF